MVKLNLDGTPDLEFEDGRVLKKVVREHIKTTMAYGSMVGITEEGKLTYDGKRDRWHGYDPSAHKLTIDRYNRMDDERRKRRQEAKVCACMSLCACLGNEAVRIVCRTTHTHIPSPHAIHLCPRTRSTV